MTQSVIAIAVVLAAAAWLLRRCYLTIVAACRGQSNKLGGCGNCSRNPANEQTPVIKLGIERPGSRSAGSQPTGSQPVGSQPVGSQPVNRDNRADSP